MTNLDLLAPLCQEFVDVDSTDMATIYFLIWKGEIAYVGKTVNLGRRLSIHDEILLRLGMQPDERARAAFAAKTQRIWNTAARVAAATRLRERAERRRAA